MINTIDVNQMLKKRRLAAHNARCLQELQDMNKEWDETRCVNHIQEVINLYCLSSRRFIMRYLLKSLVSDKVCEEGAEFTYLSLSGTNVSCFLLNPDHANNNTEKLTDNDIQNYVQLLCTLAVNNNPGVDEHAEWNWRTLMSKAMHVFKNEADNYLSREEIFLIANGLKFSMDDLEEYMIRVQGEQGFCTKKSEDYIQRFVIECNKVTNRIQAATKLQRLYEVKKQEILTSVSKRFQMSDEQIASYTMKISEESKEIISECNNSDISFDEAIEKYCNWLVSESENLDTKSQSAYRIYTNLFHYLVKSAILPQADNMERIVYSYRKERAGKQEQNRDRSAIEHATNKITREMLGCLSDKERMVTSKELNYFSNDIIGFNLRSLSLNPLSKNPALKKVDARIKKIINMEEEITKEDMLILLWCCMSLAWYREKILPWQDARIVLYLRYQTFVRTARQFLEAAYLPNIYPAHPIDYSLLISLFRVSLADDGDKGLFNNPLDLYCDIVSQLDQRGEYIKHITKKDVMAEKTVIHNDSHADPHLDEADFLHGWEMNLFNYLKVKKDSILIYYKNPENRKDKIEILLEKEAVFIGIGDKIEKIPVAEDYPKDVFVCPASKSSQEGKEYKARAAERMKILVPLCSKIEMLFENQENINCTITPFYQQAVAGKPCVLKISAWNNKRKRYLRSKSIEWFVHAESPLLKSKNPIDFALGDVRENCRSLLLAKGAAIIADQKTDLCAAAEARIAKQKDERKQRDLKIKLDAQLVKKDNDLKKYTEAIDVLCSVNAAKKIDADTISDKQIKLIWKILLNAADVDQEDYDRYLLYATR